MRIVVLGAGELGCTIAELLANEGHDVVVADSDEMRLERVRGSLDVLTVLADGVGPVKTSNDPRTRSNRISSESATTTS